MKRETSLYSYKLDMFRMIKYFHHAVQKSILSSRQFSQLQKIMSDQMLTTYFQPILDLQEGGCLGYEILNRPPQSRFFPNTEAFYEFIGHTDQLNTFERFCREISIDRFSAASREIQNSRNKVVFLNVHPQVLADTSYRSEETVKLLERYGLSPEQIVFELTEKQAIQDYVEFEQVLSSYRSQGFRIAIDDAGTGYNSLKAIVSLKPDFIKLDRALISYIDVQPDQQQIVKILKQFASSSDIQLIAEGIERLEELQFLSSEGIEYGQGYAIGKPDIKLKSPINPSHT